VRAMLAKPRQSKRSGSKKVTKPATGGKKAITSKKKLGGSHRDSKLEC
jgi:hypothetical protein